MDPLLHHYGRSGKFTFLQILIEYLNIMTIYDIFTPQGQITWSIDELCHVPSFFFVSSVKSLYGLKLTDLKQSKEKQFKTLTKNIKIC